MQGFHALAYEPMKAHIEELSARNRHLQAEISSLKSGSTSSPSRDTNLMQKEIMDLRAEISSLKYQSQEKYKFFEDSMSYTQGLDKERDSLKIQNDDLEITIQHSRDKYQCLEESHNQALEAARNSSFNGGRERVYREGHIEGYHRDRVMGVQGCRSHLLITPMGQAFMDAIRKTVPESYLHPQEFWDRIQEILEY